MKNLRMRDLALFQKIAYIYEKCVVHIAWFTTSVDHIDYVNV